METAWNAVQARLPILGSAIASMPQISHVAHRAGQLDADQLDQDLVLLLKEPFVKALTLLNSSWSFKVEPELVLVIQAILYKYSVWDIGATHGARLQGLRFAFDRNHFKRQLTPSSLPRRTIYAHAFITVLLPYIHKRARMFALARSWPDAPISHTRRRIWGLATSCETAYGFLSLVGFCLFLHNGRYRTLVERFLDLRLVAAQQALSRNVSYEFMNRQMVWHAFTEFLLFLLPLLNIRILRKRIFSAVSFIQRPLPRALGNRLRIAVETFPGHGLRFGKYMNLPDDQCAICASLGVNSKDGEVYHIQTPYMASCGHTYCYFCIVDAILRSADDGEKGWECLRCQTMVHDADRITALTLAEKNRLANDSSGSLDSLDVEGVSLGSYDSMRSAGNASVSTDGHTL